MIFLQIKLHVYFLENSKQIINFIQQLKCQQNYLNANMQHLRTSTHLLILLLYEYYLLEI